MMRGLTNALHPTFEALSAYADQGELDSVRTRAGRHVARCPQCQEVVAEIHRIGERAREELDRGELPSGLWSRIERADPGTSEEVSKPRETLPPDATTWEAAPSLRPTRHWPLPIKRPSRGVGVGLALAAAAAVVGILGLPRGNTLQASALTRMTFSPGRPVPGGIVTVRYQAASWLRTQPRVLLIGRGRRFGETVGEDWRTRDLGDSLATLRPAAGGYYEGRFRFPASAQVLELVVADTTGGDVDTDGLAAWRLVAGTSTGGPSFTALLRAAETVEALGSTPNSSAPRQAFRPADSLRRYFPSHPAGYAYADDYGTKKGIFSFLNYFQTAERKYVWLWKTLWPQQRLEGDVLHSMVVFARRIDEPGEEMQWAKRLVREHPEHPRALGALASALHGLELRQPRGLADSIRPWLPVLDSLYRRSSAPLDDWYGFRQFILRNADSASRSVWEARLDSASRRPSFFGRFYRDAELRRLPASWAHQIERDAMVECRLPAGKYPLSVVRDSWFRECAGDRGMAFGLAARWRLAHGDPRGALALTDSAGRQILRYNGCSWSGPHLTAAKAMLVLGDTALAENELAAMFDGAPSPPRAWMDTARTLLGSSFNERRLAAKVDSSGSLVRRCYESKRHAEKAAQALRQARGQ